MTTIDFYVTAVVVNDAPMRYLGPIDPWETWIMEVKVTGSDPRLTGILTFDMHGPYVALPVRSGWGPLDSKWRIDVAEGGWEGRIYLQPWVNTDEWPVSLTFYHQGVGYGLYKGTRLDFSWVWDNNNPLSWFFIGELTEAQSC